MNTENKITNLTNNLKKNTNVSSNSTEKLLSKKTTKSLTKKRPKTTTKATAEMKVKEKKNTTVKDEIVFCIENNLEITIALLSKRVGVSTHRIKKYCKSNFIDLEKLNKNNYKLMLDPKRVKEIKKQEKLSQEQKKIADEEKKKAEKLKKSLSKKNATSSKHKMPIDTSNNEKLTINCNYTKIKLF